MIYKNYKEGDYAKVVNNTAEHGQKIGQVVKVSNKASSTGLTAIGEKGEKRYYYFEDLVPLKLSEKRAKVGDKVLIKTDEYEDDFLLKGSIVRCTLPSKHQMSMFEAVDNNGNDNFWYLTVNDYQVLEEFTLCDVVNKDKILGDACMKGVESLQKLVDGVSYTSANTFEYKVTKELETIKLLLLDKNKKYGNSALQPSNIFSKVGAKEGLLIRIDDKLKRISNGSYLEGDEDVVKDLIGYLVMLRICDNE